MKSNTPAKRGKNNSTNTSRGADTAVIPRWGPADTVRMTVRASSRYNIEHTGSISSQAIGCNTPIQPFRTTNTGEVPSYLTWMRSAYDRCYVVRSRIIVQVINTTVADSVLVALSYDGNTDVSTSIDTMCETRHAQSGMIGYFAGGENSIEFRGAYTPSKFQAMSWNSADNAIVSGDPAQPYFWIISARSVTGGTGNISYHVIVEYDIEFAELTSPPP